MNEMESHPFHLPVINGDCFALQQCVVVSLLSKLYFQVLCSESDNLILSSKVRNRSPNGWSYLYLQSKKVHVSADGWLVFVEFRQLQLLMCLDHGYPDVVSM